MLSPTHECKSFQRATTKCKCTIILQRQLPQQEQFFEEEVDAFGTIPNHNSYRGDAS